MARITYLTAIDSDDGELATLPVALSDLGITRPLMVADAGLERIRTLANVQALLPTGSASYLGTPSKPNAALLRLKLDRLKQAIGLAPDIDLAADVEALNASFGLPKGLAATGGTRAQFQSVIERALADHSHATSPRLVSTEKCQSILDAAMADTSLSA